MKIKKGDRMKKTKTKSLWKIGEKYFIRTVTYHLVGEVTAIQDGFLILKNCSWVAESDRFMQTIVNGSLSEVEPVGDWFCSISSIVDGGIWQHQLPVDQK